ncbi:hypothetical protein ABGB18_45125 [Nonomuraea sp. B12E4]|uniref:hypothetical protein n=1 Tax=Nonomuraea sp. B12E4 TaxID=3153564 RepID=UPI00325C5C54
MRPAPQAFTFPAQDLGRRRSNAAKGAFLIRADVSGHSGEDIQRRPIGRAACRARRVVRCRSALAGLRTTAPLPVPGVIDAMMKPGFGTATLLVYPALTFS